MVLNNCQYSKQMRHWFFRVPHVRFGYRYHPAMDMHMCNWSMLQLHNQTMNILTHFLPALYFLFQLMQVNTQTGPYADLTWTSSTVTLTLSASVIVCCLMSSTFFHLYQPISHSVHMQLLRLDLIGIGLMIFGLILSFAYLAMHNFDQLKHAIVCLVAMCMVSNLLI